jgi:hypothetical protein
MVGLVARIVELGHAYRAVVGKPLGKRTCWRPSNGWEDNVKMDRRNCIQVAQERIKLWAFVNIILNQN